MSFDTYQKEAGVGISNELLVQPGSSYFCGFLPLQLGKLIRHSDLESHMYLFIYFWDWVSSTYLSYFFVMYLVAEQTSGTRGPTYAL